MTSYKFGKKSGAETRAKIIRGYKRFSTFANATALAIVAGNAILDAYRRIGDGRIDPWTVLLTVSGFLIGLTAAVIYIKFFTDEN